MDIDQIFHPSDNIGVVPNEEQADINFAKMQEILKNPHITQLDISNLKQYFTAYMDAPVGYFEGFAITAKARLFKSMEDIENHFSGLSNHAIQIFFYVGNKEVSETHNEERYVVRYGTLPNEEI